MTRRSERTTGGWLVPIIALLALAQGLLGGLRAFDLVSIGSDVAGRGAVLLPLIGTLFIARGILVAVIAALYAVFAVGALQHRAWARPVGMLAALVNGALVVVALFVGSGASGALLWAVVPVIMLVCLLTPAGRRAFA